MSEKRFPFDFGWKLQKDVTVYMCPACGAHDALSVDVTNEQNVGFFCKAGCSRAQVLDALSADPEAVYYIGMPAEPQHEDSSAQESVSQEKALQWLEMFSVSTFPDFVQLCKKNNNGRIPVKWEGANLDSLAAAFGYKVASDRKSIYKPPTLSTAANLLQMKLTPPQFAVEGLLPAGLCIFSAPPKSYKSWMVLDLCDSVANGMPFLGKSTNRGSVLYLDLEGTDYNLQDRMKKMGCKGSTNFQYGFDAPLLGGGLTDFLDDWCNSVESPRLIVIDVLQKVKPDGSARRNAYENDYSIYAPLNTYAASKGIAIVGVTHNRKGNGFAGDDFELITGSIGQMGSAQTTWLITGKRGITEEKHFKAIGRNIRETDHLIKFDLASWRWVNHGDADEAAEKIAQDNYAASPIRKTLIELLDVDGSGSWYGTYADLFEEIADRTGQYPYDSPNALKMGMRPFLRLLAQNDGILKEKDKHNSKYHKFYRQRLRGA